MVLLPSADVQKLINNGELEITPFEYREESVPPSTIDLRISARIVRYSFSGGEYLLGDTTDLEGTTESLKEDSYSLEPGRSAIFVLHERIRLSSSLAGIILPRSSLTRLGVSLQPTYLNPGYSGHCPILLVNNTDFRLRIPFKEGVGPRVAQILFLALAAEPHRLYGGGPDDKYQHDEGFPSRFHKDIDMIELLEPFKKVLDKI